MRLQTYRCLGNRRVGQTEYATVAQVHVPVHRMSRPPFTDSRCVINSQQTGASNLHPACTHPSALYLLESPFTLYAAPKNEHEQTRTNTFLEVTLTPALFSFPCSCQFHSKNEIIFLSHGPHRLSSHVVSDGTSAGDSQKVYSSLVATSVSQWNKPLALKEHTRGFAS